MLSGFYLDTVAISHENSREFSLQKNGNASYSIKKKRTGMGEGCKS